MRETFHANRWCEKKLGAEWKGIEIVPKRDENAGREAYFQRQGEERDE